MSTDEVCGTLGDTTENTPYVPNSPYPASKVSSDMLVRTYYETYGLNTVITNCSNNYGPKQHDEKFIPTITRNALSENDIPVYGNGENIRDWLFVMDHCRGIDLVFHKGVFGETYNIGDRNERSSIQVANIICQILDGLIPKNDKNKEQITFVDDRVGHDKRYAIDAEKIKKEFRLESAEVFEAGIIKTVKRYLKKYSE